MFAVTRALSSFAISISLVIQRVHALNGPSAFSEAADSGFISTGVGPLRLAELKRLLSVSERAISALPAGHPAKDDVRLFRSKLESLHSVAGLTEPFEFDAMLHALLENEHYGEERLGRLLATPGGGGTEATSSTPPLKEASCDVTEIARNLQADGLNSEEGAAGRRLASSTNDGTHRLPQSQTGKEEIPRAWDITTKAGDGFTARLSTFVERVIFWWQDIMDRPPPWERDCDCCFRTCPVEHHCLSQVFLSMAIRE